ncbi:hypothetical protein Tco_0493506 [Tanacetum coccineum]
MSTPTQCCDMGSDGYAYPVYDMFGIVDPNMQNEGRDTWYYSLGVFLSINEALLGSVDLVVRTYLLGGAIDGSEANGIIRDPKLELESSRFTFDLVPLSYERDRCRVALRFHGENKLKRIRGLVVSTKETENYNKERHRDLLRLDSFDLFSKVKEERKENRSLQRRGLVRIGYVMDTLKFTAMPFGLTNAPAVFIELMSRVCHGLYRQAIKRNIQDDIFNPTRSLMRSNESYVKKSWRPLKEEKMNVKFFQQHEEVEQREAILDVERNQMVMSRSCHCHGRSRRFQ